MNSATATLSSSAQAIRSDPSPHVRHAAVVHLSGATAKTAVQALARAISSDPDPRVRLAATRSIRGEPTPSSAIPALGRAVRRDPDPKIRLHAVIALSSAEDERADRALRPALLDPIAAISRAARDTLAKRASGAASHHPKPATVSTRTRGQRPNHNDSVPAGPRHMKPPRKSSGSTRTRRVQPPKALSHPAEGRGRPVPARASADEETGRLSGSIPPSISGDGTRAVNYASIDTNPTGYAVPRPLWVAPALLLSFAALSASMVPLLPSLTRLYVEAVQMIAGVHGTQYQPVTLSLRPFLGLLLCLVALFASGPLGRRLALLLISLTLYVASLVLVDVILVRLDAHGAVRPFSESGGLISACVAILASMVAVFTRYRLPPDVRVEARVPSSRRSAVVLVCSVVLSAVLAASIANLWSREFTTVARIPSLGGVGSFLLVFVVVITAVLFTIAAVDRRAKPSQGPVLSVAFLVPAHNEEQVVGDCIRSLDAAAESYEGSCRLYVAENGSTDRTAAVATEALRGCSRLAGRVLRCSQAGKSNALNIGLRAIREDIVVRVDADTFVEASLLPDLIPYFWDTNVGGVAGLPLPHHRRSWIAKMRTLEVYYNVAVKRCAQNALDAVMVLPGFMVAYRRDLLAKLGGYAEGINGEDADMTVRVGRLGYRIVSDPGIRALTEVPGTIGHLREQRMRWARGVFHVAGRNRSMVPMRQGVRALLLLPWALWSFVRRTLLLPLLVALALLVLVRSDALSLRDIAAVGAVIVVMQLVIMSCILAAHRQYRVIPFAPTYLAFRLLLIYFSLEAFLTLPLRVTEGQRLSEDSTGKGLLRSESRRRVVGWPWRGQAAEKIIAALLCALAVASVAARVVPEGGDSGVPKGGAHAVRRQRAGDVEGAPVSLRPGVVEVPRTHGLTVAEARTRLVRAGLEFRAAVPAPGFPGQVLRSTPSAGQLAAPGSTVRLVVGVTRGRLSSEVPRGRR